MGRGPTAYFIFCGEHRAEARTHVEAAAEPGQKVSVATIAKRLGELWQAQSVEEKQRYKDLVIERTKAAAEAEAVPASPSSSGDASAEGEAGEGPADGTGDKSSGDGDGDAEGEGEGADDGEEAGADEKKAPPMGLPISVVKRIMCCDEDVKRVTSGAVRATARAAELFMQLLAEKALSLARQSKRKNLRFCDIERVVRGDQRCVDMCLKEVLCSEPMFAEARGELVAATGDGDGEKENEDTTEPAPRPTKLSKKAAADIAGVRPITSFFAAS